MGLRQNGFLNILVVCWLCLLTPTSNAQTQTPIKKEIPQFPHVFELPTVSGQLKTVLAALSRKKFADAEAGLNQIITTFPWNTESHYLLASLMAIQGRKDEAFLALEKAIDLGLKNQTVLYKDPNFANIRSDKRFDKLAERLITLLAEKENNPVPSVLRQGVIGGNAPVSMKNTVWDTRFDVLKSYFKFSSRKAASASVWNAESPASKKLNKLFQRGLAAGNMGDLYDNRDKRHSSLSTKEFPQLSFTKYSDTAIQNGTDYGFNSKILFNAATIGNSSTTLGSGTFWRSLPRLGYTMPNGPQKYYLQYINNHLYIYPAVSDFMPDNGDLLPANSPYVIISEGKSGSDRPFLKAVASIMAAFKPDVKDALLKSRQLMPALQMIFRKGQKGIHTKSEYLTKKAHPTVFIGENINLIKMITLANKLEINDVPPVAHLSVVEEDGVREGVDAFTKNLSEVLFNTPASIARVFRSTNYEKRLVINTSKTQNPKDTPLTFKWVLLQGDPERVKIKKMNDNGSIAEIRVAWHDSFPSPGRPDIETSRVEIGVFTDNGKELSAPSFVNILFPTTQIRQYSKSGRILLLDHRNQKRRYADPQIFTRRDWRDEYRYDDKDRLTGWLRTRKSVKTEFSRHGAIVIDKDPLGRPLKAQQITYLYTRGKDGRMTASEKPLNEFLEYQYLDAKDQLGILVQ